MENIVEQLNIDNFEKRLFWTFTTLFFVFFIFYAYFVNQTILNIVEREEIESEVVYLDSKVSQLEFDYIALKNDLNVDFAHSVGFGDAKKISFASRSFTAQDFSMRR